MPVLSVPDSTLLRRFSVQDYHQLAVAGVLQPDERVELLDGQILKMAAKGTAHSAAVSRIADQLRPRLGDRAHLRFQDPVTLDDYSEPEPDVALVRPNPTYYDDQHPTPPDIFLLIEVSDTTLKFDCETKSLAYARSGITEYWVLDVNGRELHIYREPRENGYQDRRVLAETLTVAPLAFPDCAIAIRDVLRSQ